MYVGAKKRNNNINIAGIAVACEQALSGANISGLLCMAYFDLFMKQLCRYSNPCYCYRDYIHTDTDILQYWDHRTHSYYHTVMRD